MIVEETDYLKHYGILRKSGRYPWGSGGTQSARNRTFLDTVDNMRKDGLSNTEIARGFGITRKQLDAAKTIALNEQRQAKINMAQRLRDKGNGYSAIARRMKINESSVRALLADGVQARADILKATSNMLKDHVDKKGFLDVGSGVENQIGVSRTKLDTALAVLQEQGYVVHKVKLPQPTTDHLTEFKVLAKPGTTQKDVFLNRKDIKQVTDFTEDHGRSYLGIHPPLSVSARRVDIRYADQGGKEADGVIYVRPGVKDLNMGESRYAQVRIAIEGTHYLKGMAVYKDDLPTGVDLQFNTNKHNTGSKYDAMKKLKDDPENPFGATIRQIIKKDANGKEHNTSAMNIVNEDVDWEKWSKNLPSQMLSKQNLSLAKAQLDRTHEQRQKELDEIMHLTNPVVKKKLLDTFADQTDSAAHDLKAAHLPRQATKVILPVNSLKEHEIYAPTFNNGERVALVRYPHGGTFEIPQLTVNNHNAEAKKLIGPVAKTAVGIHHKTAEHLSGADFDGDTVVVIPNNNKLVKSRPALDGLKGFDPQSAHPPYDGMRTIDGGVYNAKTKSVDYGGKEPKGGSKQNEMGKVTNLIADMSIHGASDAEYARAIRHSMVVIDSEKHVLDHKGSYEQNGIKDLKIKYQLLPSGGQSAGASTLITRAGSEVRIPHRKAREASKGGPIDKATGKKVFEETGKTFTDRKGNKVLKTVAVDKITITDDAHTLSSGTPMESLYADHSNRLKAMANTARKEAVHTTPIPYSPSAKATYHKEVAELDAALDRIKKNRPLERQALVIADQTIALKRQANPNMDKDDLKKIKRQALVEARRRTGAEKQDVKFTQEQWNAVQAGAISKEKLEQILLKSDLDVVRKLATPRKNTVMTPSKVALAKLKLARGYTLSEVAADLGVPVSTLNSSMSAEG